MISAYIFDIDGTISDHSHRLPLIHPEREGGKDWPAFHEACVHDTPIEVMCDLLRLFRDYTPERGLFFITGRTESQRTVTQKWLRTHVGAGWYDTFPPTQVPWQSSYLLMRPDGDFRPAPELKEEFLDYILIHGKYNPRIAFEDDPRVCEMWHRRGLIVAQIGKWQGMGHDNPKDVYALPDDPAGWPLAQKDVR